MFPENSSFVVRGEDGQEYGPVDLAELREWVRENRAGIGTEVRRDEPGAAWNPWQTHPELIALLAEVHATGNSAEAVEFPPASVTKRVLAFAMDLILCGFLSFPILFTLALIYLPDWVVQSAMASLARPPGAPPELPQDVRIIGSIISDLIVAFYMAGFHFAHGTTPGKALMHLRVVGLTGEKPPLMRAFLRALMVIVSMNLFFIPFIYIFMNPQRRAFHDIVADTSVVNS